MNRRQAMNHLTYPGPSLLICFADTSPQVSVVSLLVKLLKHLFQQVEIGQVVPSGVQMAQKNDGKFLLTSMPIVFEKHRQHLWQSLRNGVFGGLSGSSQVLALLCFHCDFIMISLWCHMISYDFIERLPMSNNMELHQWRCQAPTFSQRWKHHL